MSLETLAIPLLRRVIYDTYANFPTAGIEKEDLAWATDRKCLYRWNGSAWQSIGISSRHGNYSAIGDPADYPESSIYQADDTDTLYMVVEGAWQQITTEPGMPAFAAGDIVVVAANTEIEVTGTSYTKKKEIIIASGGTARVYFEMHGNFGSYAYGKIYKNDIAHGTERSTNSASYLTYSEDLEFAKGDKVQLYCKTEADHADFRNFRLKADKAHMHMVLMD